MCYAKGLWFFEIVFKTICTPAGLMSRKGLNNILFMPDQIKDKELLHSSIFNNQWMQELFTPYVKNLMMYKEMLFYI